ncbi:MAG TPA: adenylyl-sulfate kinase [Chiayiivirga sp.]|nr:adenylyl-sulfate kinase [Chiayiivirga sp.]
MDATAPRELLRLVTCGSVDDGKSTLLGRMLFDAGLLHDDDIARLGDPPDFSRLLDGLAIEHEQGITIDVAYRYVATARRDFIIADCPGHAEYTRNMATGASTASVALVLVDARKGVLTQTRRHSWICALFGIRRVLLVVNKMDQVGYDSARFADIEAEYRALAAAVGIAEVTAVPVSATLGDNVVRRSDSTPWYAGATVLDWLETVPVEQVDLDRPMRLPIQRVHRNGQDFRGYDGNLAAGRLRPGDAVVVLPSGQRSRIRSLYVAGKPADEARQGQAVTVTLADHIDVARGDLLAPVDAPTACADQFSAHLLWLADAPLLPGRLYGLRLASSSAVARVTAIRHKIDVDSQEPLPATRLAMNEVARIHLSLDRPIAWEPYAQSRELGGFILVDRQSGQTVACGTIDFALRRAANIHWQDLAIDRAARAASLQQRPRCLWFTGLSGAGKSTIANLVEQQLHAGGRHTILLDGDNVRHGLNRDLGFTQEDRVENIRRVAEVAKLMNEAGLIVLVSFISPFRSERRMARELLGEDSFVEVFVDAPLEVCEARDSKGLYAKARAGQLRNFTGIDSPYEPPASPELHLHNHGQPPENLAQEVLRYLEQGTGG